METLQRTANRGSISTGYDIDNSLKLEADNSEYLKANNSFAYSTPTSTKTGTFSCWVKRTELGTNYLISSANSARYSRLFFNSSDQIQLYSGDSSWNSVQPITNAAFRDTSAWYHIVLRLDSTDSTAANRLRLYINGEEQTWSTSPNITQDGILTLCAIGSPTWHGYGAEFTYFTPSNFFSGYLAEVHYVDGQSLAPTEFGETDEDSGIWKPKEYDGTYGNCGYYMDFEDASNLGDDESGNGFDFDENNITAADQATDTPTNNFVTFIGDGTPFNATAGDNSYTKEGATTVYHGATTGWSTIPTTQGVYGGKWYAELKYNSAKPNLFWGVLPVSRIGELPLNTYLGATDAHDGFGFYTDSTRVRYFDGTVVSPPQNLGLSDGDIIQVAMDKDNGYVYFGINNTWTQDVNSVTGVPTSGSSGTGGWAMNYDDAYCFAASLYNPSAEYPVNFGGYTAMTISSAASDANGYGNFEYAPPSGYYALCTKNLAEYGG